jgi:hypothetical protein
MLTGGGAVPRRVGVGAASDGSSENEVVVKDGCDTDTEEERGQ